MRGRLLKIFMVILVLVPVGLTAYLANSLYHRKGVPQAFVERFSAAVGNVLKQRDVYAQLTALGLTVGYMNPRQLGEREAAYSKVWAGIIHRSGFQPQ